MSRGFAIFRFDADPQIGLGHLTRDVALARALVTDGWRCAFAVSAKTLDYSAARLQNLGDAHPVPEDEAGAARLRERWPGGCDWLIVDHYGLGLPFERSCRGWARRIAVMEDSPRRVHDCDLLVDQTLGRAASSYGKLIPADAGRLCGAEYAALDDAFHRRRMARATAQRCATSPAERRLFVSFGGGDTIGILGPLLEALAIAKFRWPVDVMAVGGDVVRSRLAGPVSRLAPGSLLHVDRLGVAEIMAEGWVAAGAGGMMALQRASLGLPSVILEIADNQTDNAATLARRGAAVSLGSVRSLNIPAMIAAIEHLFLDEEAHQVMSEAASSLIDGLGAPRVAVAFAPETDRLRRAIRLRLATLTDSESVYAWQTVPGARAYSRQPRAPTRDEHEAWFRRRLVDPRTILHVIEVAGAAAGVVRLDRSGSSAAQWEVSILVAPDYQGSGVALGALATLRRLLPDDEFVAVVLPGNETSHRLFRAAGYEWFDGRYLSHRLPERGDRLAGTQQRSSNAAIDR